MSSDRDLKLVLWIVAGLVVFWAIALPAIIKGPAFLQPQGAGPQPTSGGGGTGA